jgi:tetratricopeptide (TPR) repeat protein
MRAREFEQAITPLTRAAELNDNGDAFVRLAEVQTQRREWEGVVSAADKALEKGKLTDAAKANLLKGVALYNLDRNDDAKPPLRAAAESTQHRDMARGYLAMIEQGI